MQDPNEQVAREACSFWNVFVDYDPELHPQVPELLRQMLPQLVSQPPRPSMMGLPLARAESVSAMSYTERANKPQEAAPHPSALGGS